MKKLIFALVLTAFATNGIFAQEGDKGLKDATRAFNSYKVAAGVDKSKLHDALTGIELAANDATTAALVKTWQLRGEIYNEIATQITTIRQIGIGDLETLPKVAHPALEAAKSFTKALEIAVKKPEMKDALKGMQATQGTLQNLGIFQYEDQDFKSAFRSFATALDLHDLLLKNKEASAFDTDEKYQDQLFFTGLAGLGGGLTKEIKPYFLKLYEVQADKPAIYEALYTIEAAETSPEAAYKYVEEGRKRYPNEVSLLFADINHHLRINALDVLITKLETAISVEPDNVTLYTTMGSVYDNLYQNEMTEGNKDKAEGYATKAMDYFNQALKKDANNFDALYSIGALYYNKAAAMTLELNKLADDYSKAGLEKYKAKQAEVIAQFDLALPYFKRCEMNNPNDRNTLIALKEIFAKKDDIETSNIFKTRLEVVEGDGKNASSYFKN
jgi:tetratricopeptide (TPR) repeat protein